MPTNGRISYSRWRNCQPGTVILVAAVGLKRRISRLFWLYAWLIAPLSVGLISLLSCKKVDFYVFGLIVKSRLSCLCDSMSSKDEMEYASSHIANQKAVLRY
jgi:hypothetical protein